MGGPQLKSKTQLQVRRPDRRCGVCNYRSPEEGKQVCEVCLGNELETRVHCRECGSLFEPWKRGCLTMKNVCEGCFRTAHGFKNHNTPLIDRGVVVLNLGKHPELLQWLKGYAEAEFRTPQQQAIALLQKASRIVAVTQSLR
jgi:hypothetical protein